MNLVWLNINSSYSHSSLAMAAIEACRRGDNYTWSEVKGTINSDIFLVTNQLLEAKPTIIAATTWLFNHEVIIKICARIKQLLPDVLIVLGGPEFNGSNENFLRCNSFVDLLFRGEGEECFHDLLLGVDYSDIAGLCYIDKGGIYRDNGLARVMDFASIPKPETSCCFNYDAPFVQIETSRGCFNSCKFCVSGGDKPIRSESVDQIEERIKSVRQHGVKDIRLLDRTFNYSIPRAKKMIEIFSKFEDMNFHLEIHPALLSDELIALLRGCRDGLLHLEAGMQSLDPEVIEASGRIGTPDAAMRGLRELCSMTNFETHADLIAGLPFYTLERIYKDIRELSKVGAGEIQLELLKLLPGTVMRADAAKWGIRYSPTPPYEVLQTDAITNGELNEARLLSKLVDKFYNAKAWQSVVMTIVNNEENFLKDFLNFMSISDKLEQPLSVEKRGALLYKFCKVGYPDYLDDIALKWIVNGLSIRREEAGDIVKVKEFPSNIERESGVHYYIWTPKNSSNPSFIVAYDRAKDQSSANLIKI